MIWLSAIDWGLVGATLLVTVATFCSGMTAAFLIAGQAENANTTLIMVLVCLILVALLLIRQLRRSGRGA